jgi:hypothetical protein
MGQQKFAVDLTAVSAANDQQFALGELHIDKLGNHYRYLKNYTTGALTAYLIYTYDHDTWTISAGLTTTVAGSGETHPLCCPQFAVTQGTSSNSYYFWAFVGPGRATFTCHAAITAQAALYTTATTGAIDDDASADFQIPGLITYDAFASATDTGICKASCEMYVTSGAYTT